MSTKVRQTGYVDAERNIGKRTSLVTSTGTCILVISDPNNSGAAAGYGDLTNVSKIYIYESTNAAKTTWALRATINNPAGTTIMDSQQGLHSADLFQDDSIGVAFKCNNGSLYWVKVTYGTWAVAAAEVIVTNAGAVTWRALDVSVSEGNAPLVSAYYTTGNAGDFATVRNFVRRTTPGTWAQVSSQLVSGAAAVKDFTWDVSCCWVKGGAAGTRELFYAFSSTTTATDNGVVLFRAQIDEAAGAAVSNHTNLGTFTQNDVSKTANYALKARQIMLFPASGSGQDIFLTTQTYYPKPKFNISKWKKVSGTWTNVSPLSTYNSGLSASLAMGGHTQTAGGSTVTFFTQVLEGTGWTLVSYLVTIDSTTHAVKWGAGYFYFDNHSLPNPYHIQGGTGQWSHLSFSHDVSFYRRLATNKYDWQHTFVAAMRAPASHTPAQGATVTTSIPALSAVADLDREYGQGRIKITWELAQDAAFTTGLRTFIQADDKFATVDGTGASGKTVIFRDTLPVSLALTQGVWYIRARHTNEYGITSSADASTSFTVSHPPSAAPISPSGNQQLTFGTGNQQFDWDFSDPYSADSQTAYQLIIERIDTGAVVYDTTKTVSVNTGHTQAFVSGDKDIPMRWKVRVWDGDDIVGAYSDYALFTVVDAATIVINTPAAGAVLTSAYPTITVTPTIGGTRKIAKLKLTISSAGVTIWDSPWQIAPGTGWVSASPITYDVPQVLLKNNTLYTYSIRLVDTIGLESRASVTVSTSWTLPSSPDSRTIDLSTYNTEDQGYVTVFWTEAAPDVDFRAWVILRRDRLIDPLTLADLEVGPWQEIGIEYDVQAIEFHDYYAPSGYKCDYDVYQRVDRFGEVVDSAETAGVSVFPKSEGYWFIEPESVDSSPSAFKLAIVTQDSYTDEWEEETFNVIGGGRKVDRGQHLGLSGNLTAQIRDSAGNSARQKKIRLEKLKEVNGQLFMRTPFGDLYACSVGNMQVSRIAGVGQSEFIDVTVPYMEVGE